MRYEYITKIEIKFDKKKTFNRKSIKYLQNFIFQESVKLPGICTARKHEKGQQGHPEHHQPVCKQKRKVLNIKNLQNLRCAF